MTTPPGDEHLVLIDAALNLQQAGRHQRALEVLLEAKEQAPEYAPLWLLLGITYQELGRLEEAEGSLRKAVSLEPRSPEALQALGLLLSTQRRWLEATDLLKEYLKHDPTNLVTLRALTGTLEHLDREDEATRILQSAWEASEEENTGLEISRLLMGIGRPKEAEAILQRVVRRFETPEALTEHAIALSMLEQTQLAIECLTRALKKDPASDRTWRVLAYCHMDGDEPAEGVKAAEKALALDENLAVNWGVYGYALGAAGRTEDALKAIRSGLELIDPADHESRSILFDLLQDEWVTLVNQGHTEEALARVEEVRHLFPKEERFPQWQVSLLIALDECEKALEVLNEAFEAGLPSDGYLAPWHYEVLHLLGRSDEAWAVVEPTPETLERLLGSLTEVAFRVYERGEIDTTHAIFEQLHAYAPEEPRFVNNLAFLLIGKDKLADASQLLSRALEMADSGDLRPTTLANLGYLRLIEGHLVEAEEKLQEAISLSAVDEDAILRIAYCDNGHVQPDPVPYPTRWIPIWMAAKANQVTLALVQNQVEKAEQLASEIITDTPEAAWGHLMLGWVLRAKSDRQSARQAWQKALELTRNRQDREAIIAWLESMAHDS